jgi:hypothetical protein
LPDNRSLTQKLEQEIVPSLISGAVAAIGANMLLGVDFSAKYELFGYNVPSYLAIGGVVGGSVLLSEVAHDWIFEKLIPNNTFLTIDSAFGAPIIASVASYGLFKFGVSNDVEVVNSMLLGGISAVVGGYASNYIVGNQMMMGASKKPM